MQAENDVNKKKDILKKIFLKEEDFLNELESLVDLSKRFFMIEKETGRIVFKDKLNIPNKDKICCLLVGRYFAREFGIISSEGIFIRDLSDFLMIQKTTLSGPLRELINGGIVRKNEEGEYSILYHQIKPFLEKLNNKSGGDIDINGT